MQTEVLDADSDLTARACRKFVLVPRSEWYSGGPAIARRVVCTKKAIRVQVLRFSRPPAPRV